MLTKLEPAKVVESIWDVWSRRDKEAALTYLADDILYALYVPEDVLPFGGATRGKASVSDRLQTILDVFETDSYVGRIMSCDGDVVHGVVEYAFRHKLTQQVIDGSMRHVVKVRDGKAAEWHEYTDTERIRAFMLLVAFTAQNGQRP